MKKRALKRSAAMALAAGCLSILPAGPAAAQEYVCVPGEGGTTITILGEDYRLPGHSLPCQRVPDLTPPEIYREGLTIIVSWDRAAERFCVFGINGNCSVALEGSP